MTRNKEPRIKSPEPAPTLIERIIAGIGSVWSIAAHTVVFASCFIIAAFGLVAWELMLLVLTTIVSLEAIYLALFIQITVNRNTESLREVEEDIEEIQEDVEDIQEDVEDIQEDVEELGEDVEGIQENIEEISEDIEEIQEDVEELGEEEDGTQPAAPVVSVEKKGKKPTKTEMLDKLSEDVARVLADLEALKNAK